jgi:hypothetical protein
MPAFQKPAKKWNPKKSGQLFEVVENDYRFWLSPKLMEQNQGIKEISKYKMSLFQKPRFEIWLVGKK